MLEAGTMAYPRLTPPVRPELVSSVTDSSEIVQVERPLSTWERITGQASVRRLFLLLVIVVAWEAYARYLDKPLMLPTFMDTAAAFWAELSKPFNFRSDSNLLVKAWTSVSVLVKGYALGVLLAAIMSSLAVTTRVGNDLLSTLTSMFNPLPAIALLPLTMLWFSLGETALVVVLIHAALWPLALNMHSGFLGVSGTLRMCGRNYGLKGLRYVLQILIPAAFPAILTGLKIAWAFAWRTLIAAELVFGISGGSRGLGWFIFINKQELNIPEVFAGLGTVILIGLIIENFVFRYIEEATVKKWGMQH